MNVSDNGYKMINSDTFQLFTIMKLVKDSILDCSSEPLSFKIEIFAELFDELACDVACIFFRQSLAVICALFGVNIHLLF